MKVLSSLGSSIAFTTKTLMYLGKVFQTLLDLWCWGSVWITSNVIGCMTFEEFWFDSSMSILRNLLGTKGWTSSLIHVEDISYSLELMTSSLESPICVGAASWTSSTLEVKLLIDKKVLKKIRHLS